MRGTTYQLDPERVTRGAAMDLWLSKKSGPKQLFFPPDARKEEMIGAINKRLENDLRQDVTNFLDRCLPDKVVGYDGSIARLTESYNFFLLECAGRTMPPEAFVARRPALNPFTACEQYFVPDVGAVADALPHQLKCFSALAAPLASARMNYVQLLRAAAGDLGRDLAPKTNISLQEQKHIFIAQNQWTLLPLAYRHIEEFLAHRVVDPPGAAEELSSGDLAREAPYSDERIKILAESQAQCKAVLAELAALRQRAEAIIAEWDTAHIQTAANQFVTGLLGTFGKLFGTASSWSANKIDHLRRCLLPNGDVGWAEARVKQMHQQWIQATAYAVPAVSEVMHSYTLLRGSRAIKDVQSIITEMEQGKAKAS